MKVINKYYLFFVLTFLASFHWIYGAKETPRPNVILIISDQWSTRVADGSGNYRNGIQTPNIDRLAADGINFTQSYSNYPLCSPSRSSFYTGLYPHNHKIIRNEEYYKRINGLPDANALATLGMEFKNAGYETAFFGKEHAAGYGYAGIGKFGSMKFSSGGMLAEGSAYDPVFTRDAIAFLKNPHHKPFYMVLSLINPHDICKVLGGNVKGATFADAIHFCRNDKELYLRFQQRPGLPSNFDAPYIKGMITDKDYMYSDVYNQSENEWERYIAAYFLLIENTDWHVGLVLDALHKTGLEKNTIVVFTTDHGDMMASHKLIAKTIFYEESVKTMMIIRYPLKIKRGIVDNKSLVGSIDLMPTLLDMCNLKIPDHLDGRSFKALCYGKSDSNFSVLYSENPFGRMVRFGPYKYIHSKVYGKEYEILFDLKRDPEETTNFFGKKGYNKISLKYRRMLDEWMRKENLSLTF